MSAGRLRAALRATYCARHGWHLIGTGPARYGWARTVGAAEEWLGRTSTEAAAKVGLDARGGS